MKKHHDENDRFGFWSSRGTTYVRMPIVVFIGGIALLVLLAVWIWSVTREPNTRLHVAALHALAPDAADGVLARVEAEVTPATKFVGEFGSVMVVHTGPGLYGLAWWWEPDGEEGMRA